MILVRCYIMQSGVRELARRSPGNQLRMVPMPARKGNHEVNGTNGTVRPPGGRFFFALIQSGYFYLDKQAETEVA